MIRGHLSYTAIPTTLTDITLDDPKNPTPTDVRQGFGDELWMLVEAKRDLFAWKSNNVTAVDLKRTPGMDVLSVNTSEDFDIIDLPWNPPLDGLMVITKILVQAHNDRRSNAAHWNKHRAIQF